MGKILHIANTSFECDVIGEQATHPHFYELEYLPLLYAAPGDGLLVHKPRLCPHHTIHSYEERDFSGYDACQYWGATDQLKRWCSDRGCNTAFPPIEVMKRLCSKRFVYDIGCGLTRGRILNTPADLKAFCRDTPGNKILKSLYGFGGRGHCLREDAFAAFAKRQWDEGRAVIGEPFLERRADVSAQWRIKADGRAIYLGKLHINNTRRGSFRSATTQKGAPPCPRIAETLLESVIDSGYFGYLGMDFFEDSLGNWHCSEINPRMTMGLVALLCKQKINRDICLTYTPNRATFDQIACVQPL